MNAMEKAAVAGPTTTQTKPKQLETIFCPYQSKMSGKGT